MAMRVEIGVESELHDGRVYLTWAPVRGTARVVEGDGTDIDITLANGGVAAGGKVVFDTRRWHDGVSELPLRLAGDGTPTMFWISGEFGEPSSEYGDAAVTATMNGASVGSRRLMVRIRKDAQTLSAAERDRFLSALGQLNDAGGGPFKAFRDMHTNESDPQAHGGPGFSPWHRAYLLDLERELQALDPTVALPYWRFDQPAPGLFDAAFLGMPPLLQSDGNLVQFPAGHPLERWQTDSFPGILRRPEFAITGAPPTMRGGLKAVITERDTLDLGASYGQFRVMEGAPHGAAHVSFAGFIDTIHTAAKDPLFFLLHNNIDRLWAKWQWVEKRFDRGDPMAFQNSTKVGHRLNDTMWPWNGVTGSPRPSTAPGGPLRASPLTPQPGGAPAVAAMLDYLGVHNGQDLGFAYDDVPFEAE